jgi:peptide-methionine (R)-S-oxide reductase
MGIPGSRKRFAAGQIKVTTTDFDVTTSGVCSNSLYHGGLHMRRRYLLTGAATCLALGLLARHGGAATGAYAVTHTEAEWRKLLSPVAFDVLREQGTEPAFSSPLDHEFAAGRYDCAGCALPLFTSDTKFDSGTGWPSFFRPIEHAVLTQSDASLFMERTEVHCSRCGGHLGHVFDDGPKPTGLRYCMNGVALAFHKAGAST